MDEDEKQLLEAVSNGDKASFDILFLRYEPNLVCFVNGFIKDREAARDISQNTFLKIWQDRKKLCEIKSFKSYLFYTARFAIYNYFDHCMVKTRFSREQFMKPVIANNTEETIFLDELQELIMTALEKMPVQRTRVFKMSRFKGLSNDEIAEELGISKRTVEKHISTVLATLRPILKTFIKD